MSRISGMFWALLFLAVPVLGVATFVVYPQVRGHWLPQDVSTHGVEIDRLTAEQELYLASWGEGT